LNIAEKHCSPLLIISMGVRKTESRLPAGSQPADLGESVVSPDSHCCLISFITAPLAVGRENVYVVFVTDAGLSALVTSYEWTFTLDAGTPEVKATDIGQIVYTPSAEGYLTVKLRLLDAGATEQATLSLTQQVGPLNAELETLIAGATNNPGPGMGNPDVLRELVNDHNPYYMNVPLQTPESGDGFPQFLFSTVIDGALETKQEKRNYLLDQVAVSINNAETDFASAIAPGLGVARIRMVLLAMLLPPSPLPFTELPDGNAENAAADEQLRQKLAAMSEEDRIDLFNRVRFPKSNIMLCGKLLEAFRDKFFNGVNFDDVLRKMSGSMSDWIILNYNKGPLHRS
jgi:hypothetical protein